MQYTFFFDESFHDRKITLTNTGKLNIFEENALDSYIGVFCGFSNDKLEEENNRFLDLEKQIKNKLNLTDTDELKSVTFHKKNFNYGIQSLGKTAFFAYQTFFEFLEETKPVIYFDTISKVEFLLIKIFRNIRFSNEDIINKDVFFYSLIKFFKTYHTRKPTNMLFDSRIQYNPELLKKEFLKTIETVLHRIKGIKRKTREITALEQMYFVLKTCTFANLKIDEKVDFSYSPNFSQFEKFLISSSLNIENTSLIIDNEENTFYAAKQFNFSSIAIEDSKKTPLLHIPDLLSGFIGRIIYALYNDDTFLEDSITDIKDIYQNDLETKRLQSQTWFNLNEERFYLYEKVYKVLFCNKTLIRPYSLYSDQYFSFLALIEYIATQNWQDFYEINTQKKHPEYFNTYLCEKLETYYGSRFYADSNILINQRWKI